MILFLLFSLLFAKEREFLPPNSNSCLFLYAGLLNLHKKTLDIDSYVKSILGLQEKGEPAVFPMKDKAILEAVKRRLADLKTDFSREELRAAFYGEKVKGVFILTHQNELLTTATFQLLKDPQYENMPRLFLASNAYPIHSRELLNQATEVRYSLGGENELTLNTNVVHFAGGYCDLCLANTIKHTLDRIRTDEEEIEVHLHSSIIYGYLRPSEVPLPDINIYYKDLLFDILNGDKKTESHYSYSGSVVNHHFFKRLSDNKKVKIIFEEP